MSSIARLVLEAPLWIAFANLFSSYAGVLRQFFTGDPGPETVIFEDDQTIATYELGPEGTASFVAAANDQTFLTSEVDVGDSFAWDSIVDRFDENGQLVRRTSTADNGFVQIDSYENGLRIAKDLIDGGDEFLWAEVRNLYDADTRVRKETLRDDGVFRIDTFEDALRSRTEQFDRSESNAFDWTSIDTNYNQQGQITSRSITYDDGSGREDFFVDGNRVSAVQSDAAVSQNSWLEIRSNYNMSGDLAGKLITYDNGVVRSDQFVFGNRVSSSQTDVADAFEWDTSERLYADGVITSQKKTEDDGDIVLMLYEAGNRAERVEQDVDNSESWDVRLTTYDENGVVNVETFQGTSVLEDYAQFFEGIRPPVDVDIG